jgi:hypothetical protein
MKEVDTASELVSAGDFSVSKADVAAPQSLRKDAT